MRRYLCLLLLGLVAGTAGASGWVHVDQIPEPCCSSASLNGLHFGVAIAADLTPSNPQKIRALYVGAPDYSPTIDGNPMAQVGRVWVFVPGPAGWETVASIGPIDAQANAHFGASIAVHAGVVVIGEPDYDNQAHPNAGRITLLHDRNHNASTSPPEFDGLDTMDGAVDNARLGASVAIAGDGIETGGSGNWVAGGAPSAGAGCAFLRYLGDDQSFIDKGSVCGASNGDVFGTSIAAYSFGATNLLMAVGASGEGSTAGAAHVFFLSGGNLTGLTSVQPPTPGNFDFFGTSIAIDADRLYVGAAGRDKSGTGRTGSVSLFNPGGDNHFTFDVEVFPSGDANAGDLCGASVYPNPLGSGFAMGCPGSDAQESGEGSARAVEPVAFLGGTL